MRAASARESGGALRLARGVVLHSRLYLGWMRAAVESIAGENLRAGIGVTTTVTSRKSVALARLFRLRADWLSA